MANTVTISPLTRIEGHLGVYAQTEPIETDGKGGHRVTSARCEGEMFRGFEQILAGRDPLDAQQIVQRICGVCPISHGMAAIRAQEMAYKIKPTHNGRLLQNLILAANYMQSHVLHFYHLAALDFVDITAILKYSGADRTLRAVKTWVTDAIARKDSFPAAPFLPRYEVPYIKSEDRNVSLLSHYLQALEIRRLCHEMAAVFGARIPHSTAIVPGGCTQVPTLERVLAYRSRLDEIRGFINEVYVPDLLEVAKEFPEYLNIGASYGNFLSFGAFDIDDQGGKFIGSGTVIGGAWQALDEQLITEDVESSRFKSASGRHPSQGETEPEPDKAKAYSWLKAPRYKGSPMEVGPLARVMVHYMSPSGEWVKKAVDAFLASISVPVAKMNSVLGRHVARGLEATWVAKQADLWLDQLELDGPPAQDFEIPDKAAGYGLVEAPRGALGHWLEIDNHLIKRYQCIVPTTWNCSPRDDRGQAGPVEKALEGVVVADPKQPMELGRIVRSYDPCIGCAVH